MNPFSPVCEFNQYSLIALLEFVSIRAEPWSADPDNPLNQRRRSFFDILSLELMQGDCSVPKGQPVEIQVFQRRPTSGRFADDYGPWSTLEPKPGTQVIAFCKSNDPHTSLVQALQEACELVIELPDPNYPFALTDCRKARELKRDKDFPQSFQSPEVYSELVNNCEQFGPILARFIVDAYHRLNEQTLRLPLEDFLENGQASDLFRAEILRHVIDDFFNNSQIDLEQCAHLLRICFRVLEESPQKSPVLHELVTQVTLRNLLFDQSGQARVSANKVVRDSKARAAIQATATRKVLDADLGNRISDWLGD